jgi:hypothetical protein
MFPGVTDLLALSALVRSFAAKQIESWICSWASSGPIWLTLFGMADLNLGAISFCRIQLDCGLIIILGRGIDGNEKPALTESCGQVRDD